MLSEITAFVVGTLIVVVVILLLRFTVGRALDRHRDAPGDSRRRVENVERRLERLQEEADLMQIDKKGRH